MKLILLIISISFMFSGCDRTHSSHPIKVDNQKDRIQPIERFQDSHGTIIVYIIKVDDTEYLVNSDGGIVRISK